MKVVTIIKFKILKIIIRIKNKYKYYYNADADDVVAS